jgi:hypothetical protein
MGLDKNLTPLLGVSDDSFCIFLMGTPLPEEKVINEIMMKVGEDIGPMV